MKKKIVLSAAAMVLAFSTNSVFAAQTCPLAAGKPPVQPPPCTEECGPPPPPFKMNPKCAEKMKKEHEKRKAEFDSRLKLTDAQKATIEKNRQDGRDKMKPIFDEMQAKKLKMQEVYSSTLSQEEKNKKIADLKSEIKALRDKAHALREENMKCFETILTPEQRAEFSKMRQERRADMDKKYKKHKGKYGPCPVPPQK